MIYYVTGKLTISKPGYAIIEAGGIGYQVCIPANVYTRLPQIGSHVLLHTSHIIREISQTLYGFLNEDERDLFNEINGVTGIGPKTALSLIGHLSMEQMQAAVSQNDIQTISRVPGIGKKTAERFIIEMRDHFVAKSAKGILPANFSITLAPGDPKGQNINDAINTLINLGYNQAVAQKAVKKTMDTITGSPELAEIITTALKNV